MSKKVKNIFDTRIWLKEDESVHKLRAFREELPPLSSHKYRRLPPHALDPLGHRDLHKIPLREVVAMADRHRSGEDSPGRARDKARHDPVPVSHLHGLVHRPESVLDDDSVFLPLACLFIEAIRPCVDALHLFMNFFR